MLSYTTERKCLQAAVILACCVPLLAGGLGMLLGAGDTNIDMDSHFRYLSGLLLGIGLGFLSGVPTIERQGARYQLLTCIVQLGGLGRLLGGLIEGMPHTPMQLALIMELLITPMLCLWQSRIANRSAQN